MALFYHHAGVKAWGAHPVIRFVSFADPGFEASMYNTPQDEANGDRVVVSKHGLARVMRRMTGWYPTIPCLCDGGEMHIEAVVEGPPAEEFDASGEGYVMLISRDEEKDVTFVGLSYLLPNIYSLLEIGWSTFAKDPDEGETAGPVLRHAY